MPYHFVHPVFGQVTCDTLEELVAAGAQIGKQEGPRPSGPATKPVLGRKPAKKGKSPGTGPKKSWAMAAWHGFHIGKTANDTRPLLGKLKDEQPKDFIDLREKFESFAKWFATKIKLDAQTPLEEISGHLSNLAKEDPERFGTIVQEHDKRSGAKKK